MSIDNTAQKILELPDKGTFVFRGYKWEPDWTGEIGSYADLKAMAYLWLMRKEILTVGGIAEMFASQEGFDDEQAVASKLLDKIEALEKE